MRLKQRIRQLCDNTANISKLKKNGLHVGKNLYIGKGTFIDPSHCFLIWIGDNVTFSSNVYLLAHDASTKQHIGYTKIGQIHIGNNVFIGANTTVLPNVSIGDNSVIGAGSVVARNVPANEVWAGNPARKICEIYEYVQKFENATRFDRSYRLSSGLSECRKNEIIEATDNGLALIE